MTAVLSPAGSAEPPPVGSSSWLVEELLTDGQQLTAVEKFAPGDMIEPARNDDVVVGSFHVPFTGHGVTRPRSLLRQTEGPLTRDLLLAPGRFGLGQVPHDKQPTPRPRWSVAFVPPAAG